MIINTGQRTDIPAFYAKWFMNRIKEGFVMTRNPYYPSLVTRYSLDPELVDVIGFCTKNPHPMLPYLKDLKDYRMFWYVTITGFGHNLEPNVPDKHQVIEDFRTISAVVGPHAMGFRYTPIILTGKYTLQYHIRAFRTICESLKGYTHLAVFGFLDLYEKLKTNHPELSDCSDEDKITIAGEFQKIAKDNDMELRLCSKEKWLEAYGVDIQGCMRLTDYEKACGYPLVPKKKMQARKGYCSCFLSNDIGSYNSCLHLCRYCYANDTEETVLKNYQRHHPDSPFLIGEALPTDQVREARQESWKALGEPIAIDL